MQLVVSINSYDKIKEFQNLLHSKDIDTEIKFESKSLTMNFHENDYNTIVSLAEVNKINFSK
ncbi:hypothetical protein KPL26_11975 [Clostridium algidicarnis]|uniref:hypothetical protein n=1 Tax=Clostridium algidicarnis TaxID=37659 RepID=UPI001C0E391A|nr:hypothetical protein [Clostridium algidicarnis]MBU3197376.1 hypothetical protein [Clostridium algidicarnis]